MPSGITAPIAEGKDITAAEFIMRCARQFGGLMHMRDERLDAPIVPRKADTEHYDKNIERAKQELEYYQSMSLEKAAFECDEDYEYEVERYNKSVAEKNELRARYHAMLMKVSEWEIPTPDHKNLKDFAIKQLQESMDWDCKIYEPPVKLSAQEWLNKHIERAKHSLEFYTKQREEDIKRVEESNKWVSDLVESILAFHTKSLEEPK